MITITITYPPVIAELIDYIKRRGDKLQQETQERIAASETAWQRADILRDYDEQKQLLLDEWANLHRTYSEAHSVTT